MRVNSSCCDSVRVSGPMISCTSPPEQKFPPAPVSTTALIAVVLQLAEKIAQLRIRVESERVLARGPVEGDQPDSVLHFPQEMPWRPSTGSPRRRGSSPWRAAAGARPARGAKARRGARRSTARARAISAKLFSPLRVRRMRNARRSSGRPAARPAFFSSWSTMAVTLPPVTMSRRESSFILSPPRWRSSCAMRSKRGSVVPNSSRSPERTRRSMSWVQVSRRSQMRSAMVLAPGDEFAVHGGTPSLNRSSLKYSRAGCQSRFVLRGKTSLKFFFQLGSGGWYPGRGAYCEVSTRP